MVASPGIGYFHKTRSPAAVISLFTQSFQLFDELLQVHSRGVQNHSHQIPTEDTANREDDGYLCLTGAIEAGAVSSMITLTALRQVSLKLELPTEIFRLSDAFHNPRLRRGVLAKQLLSSRFDFGDDNDDDDDFGENIRKKGCTKTLAGDASSRLPGLMSKASSARSAERGSASGRVERKRKREIVEEGSQDEATSDSPQFKLMKLSDAEEGSFAMPECTAQQYRQQAVLDEGNRCRNMLLDNVAVQFEKTSAFSQDSKSLDSRGRSCGASFTLISLLRMSKESEKDPRMPSKVDRFVVNSLEMRMRLRDPPAAVASGTVVQLPVAEVPATLSQSVVQIARADGTPLSTSEASKTSLSLQTAATPDREAGRAQGSQLLVDSSVMEKIVRRQQKLLPFAVDMATLWKDLEQTIPADDLAVCQTLYADIDDGGMLGRTWGEMQRRVNNVEALRRCLEVLIEVDAVVRVGVTSWRYVSLPQARPWLICTLKNTRGRGHLPAADDQVCVSLEPAGEAEKSKANNASQGTLNASNNESGTPLPQHPKGQNPAQSMEAEESSGRPCTSAEQDTVGSASVEDGLTTAPPDPVASDSTPGGDSSPRKRTRPVREKQQQQAAATADSDAGEATPNSTYEKVRLVGRFWRKPEGHLHRSVLNSYLDAVMWYLMNHPGCSLANLVEHFNPIFTPVSMQELLEMLLQLGCVTETKMAATQGPVTAFSKRRPAEILQTPEACAHHVSNVYYEPTIECTIRLGQFLQFLK